MRIILIALILISGCKTYNYAGDPKLMAYPDFPEPKTDSNYLDTLQVTFGHGLVQDSGFTLQFEDTTITQALLDSLFNEAKEEKIKQDSVKHSI